MSEYLAMIEKAYICPIIAKVAIQRQLHDRRLSALASQMHNAPYSPHTTSFLLYVRSGP